ncbi:protein ZBED8 [Trichonephila clavipes]|nr:protein ZBED8 [Trichonephila clavipes]
MWVAEWNEVIFTDESRIYLKHHDGRIRVWRHRGERMPNSCVMHRHIGPAPGEGTTKYGKSKAVLLLYFTFLLSERGYSIRSVDNYDARRRGTLVWDSKRAKESKSGKSHTIGEELILPAIEEVLKTVVPKSASDIIRRIPLSNNTVQRRIYEMSQDVESFFCDYLQTTHFSLQLDETTLPGNDSLLLAYARFIMDQEHHEEMLCARALTTDTKGESIFKVLKEYFIENSIPLSNIISVATDGAPAIVGRYRGFIGHVKQNVPGVLAIHCVIHRQH